MKKTRIGNLAIQWAALLALGGLLGCAGAIRGAAPDAPALTLLSHKDYPRFADDDMGLDGLSHAIGQSIAYLETLDPERPMAFGEDTFRAADILEAMADFSAFIKEKPSGKALSEFIAKKFKVYRAADAAGVLFTGYYEPILNGSRNRSARFPCPVYGKPDDLVTVDLSPFSEDLKSRRIVGRWTGETLIPYHDRRAIETTDALSGRAPILAWAADPVDLFFLQIQGSGKLALEDGRMLDIQYHAANGRPYVAIGKVLMERGKIEKEKMSMQAIRDYLSRHPEQMEEILFHNPSYVFFRIGKDGAPKGSIGVTLTPGRSIATDSRLFPRGALAFIETRKPMVQAMEDGECRIAQWRPFSRFVLNQDTGGAIRGAGRADLFWGNGPYAEIAAGHMRHPGEMFFLAPAAPRRP